MSRFAIIVEFVIKAGQMPAFRNLILANARASVAVEPGCQQFDVLTVRNDPDRLMLYEIYDDEAAFAEHSRSPHYLAFAEASRDLVSSKSVTKLDLIDDPRGDQR
jgi:(4S)-4-hydroxy-5-phosphonooxypentane-2,3-dione isomerase